MEHGFEFRRGDVVLNLRGDGDWVAMMAARYLPMLLGGDGPADGAADVPDFPAPLRRPPHVRKAITLPEFVRLKEVSEPADLVLALAYFLEKYEGLPHYGVSDLQPYLGDIGLDEAAVEKALRHHAGLNLLIAEDGRYSLTYTGEQRVKLGDFPEGPSGT